MSKSSTIVLVFGASGRMGQRLCALASDDDAFTLAGAVVRAGSPRAGQLSADGRTALKTPENTAENTRCDVVIDFSSADGLADSIALARRLNAALLVGTTALPDASVALLRAESASRGILLAPNTSLGVAVLSDLCATAARLLGPGYQCSIVEAHHSKKKDAPSGTALRLAASVRSAGHDLTDDQILAVRGGDVIGEHTVRFAGQGEYIELTHRATTRDLFARGALRAAAWLKGRKPGWYTINDVVGLGP